MTTKVKRVVVEFEDGSKSSFEGIRGYVNKGHSQIPVEGELPINWPTIETVSVHLTVGDSRNDPSTLADPPESIPEKPEEAQNVDD